MDKIKFAKAMAYLFEAKMKPCPETTIQVWFDLLKDFPEEKVIAATLDLARSPDQFINVGMIIERVKPNITAEAEEAWNQALRSAESAGRLPISNTTARTLNALGGMMKLRDCPIDDLHWLHKEFISVYANLQHSDIQVGECYGLTGGIKEGRKEIEAPAEIKQMLAGIGQRI
jgi:hypothetical protein